jgi:dolichyl-phosphate-mannose--protein O-mannosyl transferase
MSLGWKAAMVIGTVTVLTGGLRFVRLAQPERKVFDEVYYASDGCWYAGMPYRSCGLEADAERSWVHPPLGKHVIALGVVAFGNDPFGWRVAAAVAGTATVALAGTLAYLLLGSALWGGVGALLAGTEHLLLVQSRIAMLDVFLAMFVVLGFTLLVLDRRRLDRRSSEEPGGRPARVIRGWRPLLLLAGASFGAAVAVKWSGLLALLGAIILAAGWARSRQRAFGSPRPLLSSLRDEGPGLWLGLVAVPLVAYSVTWLPWLADRGFDVGGWITHHLQMIDYHLHLDTVKENGEPIHPYMSRAWSWFLLLRPVSYFWQGDPRCCAEILGLGHPLLFWGSLLMLPYLTLVWRARRDWTAGAILVPVLVQFVPWLIVSRPLFLFYMTPITPFLAVGMAFVLRDISVARFDRRITVPAVALVVAAFVGVFAFFWPVLTADPISREAWSARIWLDGWV